MKRRDFLKLCAAGVIIPSVVPVRKLFAQAAGPKVPSIEVKPGEDVFAYISRLKGSFDPTLYQQVIGTSNAFKEGDQTIGVGAGDEGARQNARALLANTKIKDLYDHPLLVDDLQKLIWQTTDQAQYEKVKGWTMGELKEFLLAKSEVEIKGIMHGLTSEVIGCIPKLTSNEELIRIN
jgi:ethanolamine ammonia-lyase large subunit